MTKISYHYFFFIISQFAVPPKSFTYYKDKSFSRLQNIKKDGGYLDQSGGR